MKKRFEYKTDTMGYKEYSGLFERILNEQGRCDYSQNGGWEVCATFRKYWWRNNPIVVIFKREIKT